MGFNEVKKLLIDALKNGSFQNEARDASKNLLATGDFSVDDLMDLIKKSSGSNHQSSPHHQDGNIDVHVIQARGWYIKFFFLDPDVIFISVHQ
jgi:hypothetical protein